MTFLPALLPDYFPANGLDGSNTSALWLEVMGTVNNLLGTALIARWLPAAVARLLAWRMPVPVETRAIVPVRRLRPALRPADSSPQVYRGLKIYRGLNDKARQRVAA